MLGCFIYPNSRKSLPVQTRSISDQSLQLLLFGLPLWGWVHLSWLFEWEGDLEKTRNSLHSGSFLYEEEGFWRSQNYIQQLDQAKLQVCVNLGGTGNKCFLYWWIWPCRRILPQFCKAEFQSRHPVGKHSPDDHPKSKTRDDWCFVFDWLFKHLS